MPHYGLQNPFWSAARKKRAKREAEELCAALPHGEVELTTEAGGMLAETGVPGDRMLIALASVVVCIVDP